jgi:hypothetical protein
MGRLRLEPKVNPPVSERECEELRTLLRQAYTSAHNHRIFYDLHEGETPSRLRTAFEYVAGQMGLDLRIRLHRKKNSLELRFNASRGSSIRGRVPAEEARKRIVATLRTARIPLGKSEIIGRAGISPTTSASRLSELVESGTVKRCGSGPRTTYCLR